MHTPDKQKKLLPWPLAFEVGAAGRAQFRVCFEQIAYVCFDLHHQTHRRATPHRGGAAEKAYLQSCRTRILRSPLTWGRRGGPNFVFVLSRLHASALICIIKRSGAPLLSAAGAAENVYLQSCRTRVSWSPLKWGRRGGPNFVFVLNKPYSSVSINRVERSGAPLFSAAGRRKKFIFKVAGHEFCEAL